MAQLKAGIAADEDRANAMQHFTVYEEPYYSCAASRTEPLGDLEWGADAQCDCFLAERKARALREVVFKRAILDMHAELWRLYRTFEQAGEPGLISLGRAQGLSRVLERLAFVYGNDGI